MCVCGLMTQSAQRDRVLYERDNPNVLTILFFFLLCLLVQEVGSIIGKKGEIVKRFREEVNNSVPKFLSLFFWDVVLRGLEEIGTLLLLRQRSQLMGPFLSVDVLPSTSVLYCTEEKGDFFFFFHLSRWFHGAS